jgi:phospholipase/lecithinase/hemolysin
MRAWSFSWLAALALCLLSGARSAEAASYPAIYIFGDSLSDAGNDWQLTLRRLPQSPPYSHGRFSNGPIWIQQLGIALGISTLKPSLLGGSDYAYGGAQSGPTSVHTVSAIDLPTQLAQFEANVSHPNSGALYVLWIGANDLFDILSKNLAPSDQAHAIGDVIRNEEVFVTTIALNGATHLMVPTAPDLGVTPTITSQGAAASKAATALSQQYNAQLISRMQFLASLYGLDLTIVDTFSLIDSAVADPRHYGFTNVTAPCWTGSYTNPQGGLCALGEAAQNKYLFWDRIHPTARGHLFVADAAKAALSHSGVALVSVEQ